MKNLYKVTVTPVTQKNEYYVLARSKGEAAKFADNKAKIDEKNGTVQDVEFVVKLGKILTTTAPLQYRDWK